MSMMDPDVEFFGVEIPPSDLVSVEEHLETDDATYASIHATQVLHWPHTVAKCYFCLHIAMCLESLFHFLHSWAHIRLNFLMFCAVWL